MRLVTATYVEVAGPLLERPPVLRPGLRSGCYRQAHHPDLQIFRTSERITAHRRDSDHHHTTVGEHAPGLARMGGARLPGYAAPVPYGALALRPGKAALGGLAKGNLRQVRSDVLRIQANKLLI